MLFERIESEGIAHYSYLVGEGNQAAVIDPRRDCGVYIARALAAGMRIGAILETHVEDYLAQRSLRLLLLRLLLLCLLGQRRSRRRADAAATVR